MRFRNMLVPTAIALAAGMTLPALAQNNNMNGYGSDTGWGDMGRSSEYYDFRDPGPDRYYNRYEDSLRDWNRDRRADRYDRRWNESRRNMDRYRDDWHSSQRDSRRGYRDYDSAERDNYYYDYGRNGGPYYQDRYSQDWRDGDRYWSRYDRDGRSAMGQRGSRYDDRYARDYDRDWRSNQGGDYTADRYDGVDFGDMNIDDRAQWHERTYRGTANRGLHD